MIRRKVGEIHLDIKKILKKLDREFLPRFFNTSEIDEYLKNNEKKVIIVLRIPDNAEAYENFDRDFSTYLGKLPNSPLKKSIGFIFNKKLIYYGISNNTQGVTYARVLISKNEKLVGIVLNAYALDISVRNGTSPSVDDVVYSSYYGLIRAATVIHKQEIRRDRELQKLICNFLYILILKIIGRSIMIGDQQKKLLQLICVYLFYKQFLEEKHIKILNILHKHYNDIFNEDDFKTFEPYIDKINSFNNFKDLPRVIQLFNIADINSSQLMMHIIRSISSNGFHTLIGSLDNLISSIILNRYPTEIVSRGFTVNLDVQEKIEQKMIFYINKINYGDDFNTLANKVSSKEKK